MAENSKIEWCDHTVNLWWGCAKVHTGCKNCYAETTSKRFGDDIWGENKNRKRIKSAFSDLDKYQKHAEKAGKKIKVFVGSMMDIFEDTKPLSNPIGTNIEYSGQLKYKLLQNIHLKKYENLIFLFLTKRPKRIRPTIPMFWLVNPPKNVWFGTSISDQETAYNLLNDLLIYTPYNSNLFLSIEPQIGHIDLSNYLLDKKDLENGVLRQPIKWIIQGGESGKNRRPFNLDWAYSMKEQCKKADIPYFFKQIDKVQSIPSDLMVREFPKEFFD